MLEHKNLSLILPNLTKQGNELIARSLQSEFSTEFDFPTNKIGKFRNIVARMTSGKNGYKDFIAAEKEAAIIPDSMRKSPLLNGVSSESLIKVINRLQHFMGNPLVFLGAYKYLSDSAISTLKNAGLDKETYTCLLKAECYRVTYRAGWNKFEAFFFSDSDIVLVNSSSVNKDDWYYVGESTPEKMYALFLRLQVHACDYINSSAVHTTA